MSCTAAIIYEYVTFYVGRSKAIAGKYILYCLQPGQYLDIVQERRQVPGRYLDTV